MANRPAARAPGGDYRSRMYETYNTTLRSDTSPPSLRDFAAGEPWFRSLLGPFLPRSQDAAILDVGCGTGRLVWLLQRHGYTNVRGVDDSPEQVAIARSFGLDTVLRGDAGDYLRSHPGEFDLITAIDVLEHLGKNEVLDLLDAAHAALRPGGQVLIQTANGIGPFGGRYLYSDFTHQGAFSAPSIRQVLRRCGFAQIVVAEVQPIPHGFVSALRKLLWLAIRILLIGYLAVETGQVRGHVLTQNLLATARRVD